MNNALSRRDFLKLSGLALGSLAFNNGFPDPREQDLGTVARVTIDQIDLHARPHDTSAIVGNRFRDQLVHIYAPVIDPDGPEYFNNLWYRVWGGYLHSAYLQIVGYHLNEPSSQVSEGGTLVEVTVPYTIAYQNNSRNGWQPWRGEPLYFQTTHWATAVEEGPDGKPWYQIVSELSKLEKYYAPAKHFRLIPPAEISPLSPDVPADKKRIEVSILEQKLRAFEGDKLVLDTKISSGIPSRTPKGALPTATPKGSFRIYSKNPNKHMGSITGNPDTENGGFSLPGVPWTCFFEDPGGYAFHGTYWHNNFGFQMSHGCVNLRNEDAKWLFRWTTPVYELEQVKSPEDWEKNGNGTQVEIS
jgi:lipoprotein-anchoring transpeptidase ErfK/SrfK